MTSHSHVVIPPECGFIIWLHKKYSSWQAEDSRDTNTVEAFTNDLLACKKFDTWLLDSVLIRNQVRAFQPQNYAELCSVVFYCFGIETGKNVELWGDKNNFHLNHLNELHELFENARFLHIIRDGRDVACSYREVMEAKSTSPYAPVLETDIVNIAHEWSQNVTKIEAFTSSLSRDETLTVKYEDLTLTPALTIMRICEWLDIQFESEMLNSHTMNKLSKLEPDLTLDWKKRTLQPINSETVGRYSILLSLGEQEEFLLKAKSALKLFSYI